MSIVVLIDFIAILVTPGIFLIQIVNTNNTNMYLIHFHSKILLQCIFIKVEFLKFKTDSDIHYPSERGEINCWHQQRRHNSGLKPDFQKK